MIPTDAVQPDTSSSYFGSEICQQQIPTGSRVYRVHTTQDRAVDREEAVLQRLFEVLALEGLLLGHDLVEVFSRVQGTTARIFCPVAFMMGQSRFPKS